MTTDMITSDLTVLYVFEVGLTVDIIYSPHEFFNNIYTLNSIYCK